MALSFACDEKCNSSPRLALHSFIAPPPFGALSLRRLAAMSRERLMHVCATCQLVINELNQTPKSMDFQLRRCLRKDCVRELCTCISMFVLHGVRCVDISSCLSPLDRWVHEPPVDAAVQPVRGGGGPLRALQLPLLRGAERGRRHSAAVRPVEASLLDIVTLGCGVWTAACLEVVSESMSSFAG